MCRVEERAPLRAKNLQDVPRLIDDRHPLLQERRGHAPVELHVRADRLASQCPHSTRRGHHVIGVDGSPVRPRRCVYPPAMTGQFHHRVQRVSTDVQQPVSTVIALAAAVYVPQPADATVRYGPMYRAHRASRARLMMDRDPNALLGRLRQHVVRLVQLDADRLLDLDMHSVLQHPHREGIVKLRSRRNRDDVWLRLHDHRVKVVVPRGDAELIPQGVYALLYQVTQADHLHPRVSVIGPARRPSPSPATENRNPVRLHHSGPLRGFRRLYANGARGMSPARLILGV